MLFLNPKTIKMKEVLTVILLSILGISHLPAQLEIAYQKFYDDGFIDTVGFSDDLIRLENGDFLLSSKRNRTGEVDFSMNLDRFNSQGDQIASIPLASMGDANLSKLGEAPDGSIWMVYSLTSGTSQTRILHFSPNLDSIKVEVVLDLIPGAELPYGILARDGQLLILMQGTLINDATGLLEDTYTLFSLNTGTLAIEQIKRDAFPRGSRVRSRSIELSVVGNDRIGIGLTPTDTSFIDGEIIRRDVILVREFDINDLSQVAEYKTQDFNSFGYISDYTYVPTIDAYAVLKSDFTIYLFNRDTLDKPQLDSIISPGRLSGDLNNTLSYLDGNLYALGRHVFRVDLSGGIVGAINSFSDFPWQHNSLIEVDRSGNILQVYSSNGSIRGLSANIFTTEDAQYENVLQLMPPGGANKFLTRYGGAYSFTAATTPSSPILGVQQSGQVGNMQNTNGYALLDVNTGALTGQSISTGDIEFWSDEEERDPFLHPLAQVGNDYMSFVIEQDSVSFFKFNQDFEVVDPNVIGRAAIGFGPAVTLGSGNFVSTAPTSYGVIGVTSGFVFEEDDFQRQYPYFFAADSSMSSRVATTMDTLPYAVWAIMLAVDTLDGFYSVGIQASTENTYDQVDTLIITGHEADATLRFVRQIKIPEVNICPSCFQAINLRKAVLNNEQTELLISGYYIYDDGPINSTAFLMRVSVLDGSLIEIKTIIPESLGLKTRGSISACIAEYDSKGNIIIAVSGFERDSTGRRTYQTNVLQMDTTGAILDNEIITVPSDRPVGINSFTRIGDAFYLSSFNLINNLEQEFYITRINSGVLVNTKVTNKSFANQFELNAFPNPVYNQVNVNWQQQKASDYNLQLLDMNGRILRQWSGHQNTGEAQVQVSMGDLPKGPYLLRLEVADTYTVKQVFKQ